MTTEVLATEATLSTLKVEIKALVVSGKQMTLAVFRQLPCMSVLAGDQRLHDGARYWGTVRYSINNEGERWAVIELEGRLYRGSFDGKERTEQHYMRDCYVSRESREGRIFYYLDHLNSIIADFPGEDRFNGHWRLDIKPFGWWPAKYTEGLQALIDRLNSPPSWSAPEFDVLVRDLKEFRRKTLSSMTAERDHFRAEYGVIAARYAANHALSMRHLLSLAQLFIAV